MHCRKWGFCCWQKYSGSNLRYSIYGWRLKLRYHNIVFCYPLCTWTMGFSCDTYFQDSRVIQAREKNRYVRRFILLTVARHDQQDFCFTFRQDFSDISLRFSQVVCLIRYYTSNVGVSIESERIINRSLLNAFLLNVFILRIPLSKPGWSWTWVRKNPWPIVYAGGIG